MNYLHHNPVRTGMVARAEDWVYSSAGYYAGEKGIMESDMLDYRWQTGGLPDNGVPKLELGNEEGAGAWERGEKVGGAHPTWWHYMVAQAFQPVLFFSPAGIAAPPIHQPL